MLKYSSCIAIGCLISASFAIAQSPIEVTYESNPQGHLVFYATNRNVATFTVKVMFRELVNGRADEPLPYLGTVPTGRSRLFSIKPERDGIHPRFSYNTRYASGCLENHPDTSVVYALPVPKGKEVLLSPLSYLGEKYGSGMTPEHWNATSFRVALNDTVVAARRGRVIEVRFQETAVRNNTSYDRNANTIVIEHKDCTHATYSVLNKALVSVGQLVEVGTPLALAGGEGYNSGPHFRFMVSYADVARMLSDEGTPNKPQIYYYFPLTFYTDEGRIRLPLTERPQGQLTAAHPDWLLVQEMGKRTAKKRKS